MYLKVSVQDYILGKGYKVFFLPSVYIKGTVDGDNKEVTLSMKYQITYMAIVGFIVLVF